MILETDRLLLEPFDPRHLGDFTSLMSGKRAMRHIGLGEAWTRSQSEERFAWHLDHWRRHGFGWRAALDRSSRVLLGFVGISYARPEAVELEPGDVEIGWRLARGVTGRGLATEAALAVRDDGLGRIGLHRLAGRCQPTNAASARVMEKIGMRLERKSRGRHGEPVLIYGLNRETWLEVAAA